MIKLSGQHTYRVSYPCLNTTSVAGNGEQIFVNAYLYINGIPNSIYKLYYSNSKDTFKGEINQKGFDTVVLDSATRMAPFIYKWPNVPTGVSNYLLDGVLNFISDQPASIKGYLEYSVQSWDGTQRSVLSRVQNLELEGFANCKNNFSPNISGGTFPCFSGNSTSVHLKKQTYQSISAYTPTLFKNMPWYYYGSRQILQVLSNSDSAIVEITGSVDLLNGQKKG
ncbi:MAG: hypothetical protein ACOVQJ_01545, partial [Bacteroidia bacterium]